MFHWCGNPLHDIPLAILTLLLAIPGISLSYNWLRAKFTKKKPEPDSCCPCHKSE